MTELDVLIEISGKLDILIIGVQNIFLTLLLFKFIDWTRLIVSRWKRGNGFNV